MRTKSDRREPKRRKIVLRSRAARMMDAQANTKEIEAEKNGAGGRNVGVKKGSGRAEEKAGYIY